MSTPTTVKERPILFSGAMVRALLAGTKTQTRRIMRPQPGFTTGRRSWLGSLAADMRAFVWGKPVGAHDPINYYQDESIRNPYGAPGDRLWVRESFWKAFRSVDGDHGVVYRADYLPPTQLDPQIYHQKGSWRPSIHMPRIYSRILLEITDVRVQRLQEISEEDAIAEGHPPTHSDPNPLLWYRTLWQQINGAGSWDANPWVWCLTFKRVQP